MQKRGVLKIFAKSQISAAIATAVDWSIYILLTAIFGKSTYVVARVISSAVGAVVSFRLNRYWTWKVGYKSLRPQATNYGITSLISLLLNTFGTWLLTEHMSIDYRLSAVIVSLLVAVCFNFMMHHFFVFKKQ